MCLLSRMCVHVNAWLNTWAVLVYKNKCDLEALAEFMSGYVLRERFLKYLWWAEIIDYLRAGSVCGVVKVRCSENKVVLVYSISIQLPLEIWNMEACFSMLNIVYNLGKKEKKIVSMSFQNRKGIYWKWVGSFFFFFFFSFFSPALPFSFRVCRRTFSLSG